MPATAMAAFKDNTRSAYLLLVKLHFYPKPLRTTVLVTTNPNALIRCMQNPLCSHTNSLVKVTNAAIYKGTLWVHAINAETNVLWPLLAL